MKCLVCHHTEWTLLFNAKDRMFRLPGIFSETQCKHCGFICLSPFLSQKQQKRYYPSNRYYSYMSRRNQDFFSKLRTFLIRLQYRNGFLSKIITGIIQVPAMPYSSRGRILDVGCGSGETLSILESLGWVGYGIDIDAHAIDEAKKRGLCNVIQGTYEKMKKYPNNFFDAIRLYHVIEHIDKPDVFLALASKKLRPGGELILGTPNGSSLAAKWTKQYWYNLDAPRHVFIFNPNTLTRLTRRYNFVDETIRFCSAGGWLGSMQYFLEEKLHTKVNLIHRQWLVMLFYPFEWLLDRLSLGDVFVLRARLNHE